MSDVFKQEYFSSIDLVNSENGFLTSQYIKIYSYKNWVNEIHASVFLMFKH